MGGLPVLGSNLAPGRGPSGGRREPRVQGRPPCGWLAVAWAGLAWAGWAFGLISASFLLDFASGFHLRGFWQDLGRFAWISAWISHIRLLFLGFFSILAS